MTYKMCINFIGRLYWIVKAKISCQRHTLVGGYPTAPPASTIMSVVVRQQTPYKCTTNIATFPHNLCYKCKATRHLQFWELHAVWNKSVLVELCPRKRIFMLNFRLFVVVWSFRQCVVCRNRVDHFALVWLYPVCIYIILLTCQNRVHSIQ